MSINAGDKIVIDELQFYTEVVGKIATVIKVCDDLLFIKFDFNPQLVILNITQDKFHIYSE